MDACGLTPAEAGKLERLQAVCSGVVEESAQDLLRVVWDETVGELSRLVRALGADAAGADDILQDVYLTAWQKCPPDTGRAGLRRWLLRVAVNRCRLEHRRRTRWRSVLQGLRRIWRGADGAADAGTMASGNEERLLVRQALQGLEPQARSILVLRYFAELNSKEIGRVLQLPHSTVRSHLRAARQQLALEVKRAGYTHDGTF